MNTELIQNGETQFRALQKAAIDTAEQCNAITISDPITLAIAHQQLSLVKEKWNQIDALRETLKKPSLEEGRAVDALAKPLLTPLADALAKGKAKILVWDKLQIEKFMSENVTTRPPEPPKGMRETMKFEVVDMEKMPALWLMPNEATINDFLKQYKEEIKDGMVINGVKFYLQKSVTIR